jgi:hypothetical protein
MPTWTLPDEITSPWARASCRRDDSPFESGLVYQQYVNLGPAPNYQPGPFRAGPTPSWPAGDASCTIELIDVVPIPATGTWPAIAASTFEVVGG